MVRKLISLNFKPSDELPELEELKAFLGTDFNRQVPGFTVLDTDAKWGELVLALVGVDADRGLVAIFTSVSLQERDYHDVISQAMLASTWLEENREEVTRRYPSVSLERPLRVLLVAPKLSNASRALTRALERAGVEMMTYSIFDIETSDGGLRAVTFGNGEAPASPAAAASESRRAVEPRPVAPPESPRLEPPRPAPVEIRAAAPEPKAEPKPAPEPRPEKKASPVDAFIATLQDPNIKTMSEQIMTFLTSRFPNAEGVVNPGDRGFTLTVGREHLATIRLDRNSLWLEVGPEKIPTNKIKDPATLERAMNLPSVLEALHSVHTP